MVLAAFSALIRSASCHAASAFMRCAENAVECAKEPFDLLAKGLAVLLSRDNKTAIELFLTGLRGWHTGLRRRIEDGRALYQ